MISQAEFLMGRLKFEEMTTEQQLNAVITLERINKVRTAWGKPMKVNDGVRRPQDTPKNGAAKSKHLLAMAIDIDDDANGTLWKWLMQPEQMKLLQEVGLWLEHGCWTHYIDPVTKQERSWVHFQIAPPNSGKRIFVPSTAPNPAPTFWDGHYDSKYDVDLSKAA